MGEGKKEKECTTEGKSRWRRDEKVGLIFAKAAALHININTDGSPVAMGATALCTHVAPHTVRRLHHFLPPRVLHDPLNLASDPPQPNTSFSPILLAVQYVTAE